MDGKRSNSKHSFCCVYSLILYLIEVLFVLSKNSAKMVNQLGNLFKQFCKYDAAIEKLELSGKIHYALSGGNRTITKLHWFGMKSHSKSSRSCLEMITKIAPLNVGNTLLILKRYDEARVHIDQAIRINERVFGTAHVSVAGSLAMLGEILRSQSQFDEALRVLERSLAIYRTSQLDSNIGIVLQSIGDLYVEQNRFDLALETFRVNLSVSLRSFGENHLHTASVVEEYRQNFIAAS